MASRLLPVELPPHGVELALVGVATLVALAGLVAGFRRTLARPIPAARAAPPETGLARLLNRKYYVDELYDTVVVRPLMAISRSWLWRGIDTGLIDGFLVNGAARASRAIGRVGSRLQTGQVSAYLLLFLVGALWVLRVVTR